MFFLLFFKVRNLTDFTVSSHQYFSVPQHLRLQQEISFLKKKTQVRFEILTKAIIKNTVFRDVTTCNLVDSYQHFLGTCSFLLQTWRQCKQVPTKCQDVYTRLHGITSQETVFFRCLKSPVLSASVRQYSVSLYIIIPLYFSLQKTTMHTWNSHC